MKHYGTTFCSLCQTIWTRGLPARDSSSITGLALDKSFPYSLYYHGVILKRPRDRQHGDINPDPPATAPLQHAITWKPYGLVPFFGYRPVLVRGSVYISHRIIYISWYVLPGISLHMNKRWKKALPIYNNENKKNGSPTCNRRWRCSSGRYEGPERCQLSPLNSEIDEQSLCTCTSYLSFSFGPGAKSNFRPIRPWGG